MLLCRVCYLLFIYNQCSIIRWRSWQSRDCSVLYCFSPFGFFSPIFLNHCFLHYKVGKMYIIICFWKVRIVFACLIILYWKDWILLVFWTYKRTWCRTITVGFARLRFASCFITDYSIFWQVILLLTLGFLFVRWEYICFLI